LAVRRSPFASSRQRDGVDVAAIIPFAAVGGATEAEEARRVGIGAQIKVLDVPDSGSLEAGGNVTGEIEQGMAGTRGGNEETLICLPLGGKARARG
jgi:hypothetical protein